MRTGILVPGLALCIALACAWLAGPMDHITARALTDDARLAIDVRCRDHDDSASRECRDTLKRLYLSGALDPDKTLRTYCDSVRSGRWGGSQPPPPSLCVERYGGWKES